MHFLKHPPPHTLSALHSGFSYLEPQETAVYHYTTTGNMPTDRKAISHARTCRLLPPTRSVTTLLNPTTAAASVRFNAGTRDEDP